jgi:4-amino-4-deoxy-L-arabinose transferase-like glycosyltransferase
MKKMGSVPIFLLFAAWLVPGLFGHDPWKPDEAYTFGLVYHIVETGDWLVPTLGGEPFVEKPPVFFWTAALFAKLFGWAMPLHDAAHLASAFYVVITLVSTALTARRLYGPSAALPAALLLAGSLGYLQHAHQLITDNALMAGIAIGIYGLAALNGFWLGTGAGLAFLSKGLLGPGLLALTALAMVALPAWRQSWRAWPSALLALVPWALIWPWLLYQRSPELFHEWFIVNNFGRFTGEAGLGGVLDHLHYAKALVWFGLPAWPIAAWAVWKRESSAKALQLPLAAFGVMFVVLSAASSARTLYALPMLVPLALLAAGALPPRALLRVMERAGAWTGLAAGIVLWAAWLAFVAGWRPGLLETQSPGFIPSFQVGYLLGALAVTAIGIYALRLQPRMPVRWLAGVALVWGLAMTLWLPWLDHAKSYRGVIADMKAHAAPGCIAARGLTEPQRAMFDYYAGVRAGIGDCPNLVVHTASPEMPDAGAEWKPLWRGTRPGDDKEFFWLFRR